jgi:DNA-binding FadR family transcriptional regulator
MEKASRALEGADEATGNEVAATVGGTKKYVLEALKVLVAEGYVEVRKGTGRAVLHRSARPYREAFETDIPNDSRSGND